MKLPSEAPPPERAKDDASAETLLAAARAGSPDGLGRLLEAYRPLLALAAEARLPEDIRAKVGLSDLMQETFAEAFRDFPRFQGRSEEELLAWLHRILEHNARDLARRYRRRKRRAGQEVPLQGNASSSGLAGRLEDSGPSPSSDARGREETDALEHALAQLPEDYRRIILLRHRDGLPFAEAARQLGRSEAATRKLWARAVERWTQEFKALYGSS
jgi:RNA polymerase sigma-70 factor (ECF subfamily)